MYEGIASKRCTGDADQKWKVPAFEWVAAMFRENDANWITEMERALGDALSGNDFDTRFVRFLIGKLDQAGFRNVSFALLRAAIEASSEDSDREEFDALVDLGMELMSREDRSFAPARRMGLDGDAADGDSGHHGGM